MIIKLLIATADSDYAEYLSDNLSEKYADTFNVSVCSSAERLRDLLAVSKFDAALLEPSFVAGENLSSIQLPMLLIDELGDSGDSMLRGIRKYQRISNISGYVLEYYAEAGKGRSGLNADKANITAVWSPAGGVGKTTVALAYASNRILSGKQSTYLNLENFSSTSAYFQESGRSISKVFEKLDTNVQMFLAGICQHDSGTGITYFCEPENYDDINILTADDAQTLIDACATGTDEVVIDLSSQCDERTQRIFDMADIVLIVCDPSSASQVKLRQFENQHNVFEQVQEKAIIVNNKGAKPAQTAINRSVQLPFVQSPDPISIYKTLSSASFHNA